MNQDKVVLRQKLQARRLSMDRQDAARYSRIISKKVLDSINWNNVKKLHIYSSVMAWNEVDTKQIIDCLREDWAQISITAKPAGKDEPFPGEKYDLIIVPVLGFDKQNYRLGLGGGWYDRFLAGQKQARTIGLAYRSAKLSSLPHEQHDIALDTIITEV